MSAEFQEFWVGKTSVILGEFEIGTIYGFGFPGDRGYVVTRNGVPTVYPDDWDRAKNFFLDRVPVECKPHVRFVRKPFGET